MNQDIPIDNEKELSDGLYNITFTDIFHILLSEFQRISWKEFLMILILILMFVSLLKGILFKDAKEIRERGEKLNISYVSEKILV